MCPHVLSRVTLNGEFFLFTALCHRGRTEYWASTTHSERSHFCNSVLIHHTHSDFLRSALPDKIGRAVSGPNEIALKVKVTRRMTNVDCFSTLETILMVLLEIR